jgi:hypothetical protein
MGFTPDDGKNKPKKGNNEGKGDGAGQNADNGQSTSPDDGSTLELGALVGPGFYTLKDPDTGKVLAGGAALGFENAIALNKPEFSGAMLGMLNIKSPSDVARALNGDGGSSTSTSVGYNSKYGKNWESAFGNKQSKN